MFNKANGTKEVNIHRENFFDKIVYLAPWKESMKGKNEMSVLRALEGLGYIDEVDFKRQYPIAGRFVLDFAFVNEQVAIEVDGESHKYKEQKTKDKKRDKYLGQNNWVSIRIKDKDFFGYKASFYKSFIKQIVEQRREDYNKGTLYPLDLTAYYDQDYE